jgi:hypothetical protein
MFVKSILQRICQTILRFYFLQKKIKNKAISEYYKLLVSQEVTGRILCSL